MEGVARAITGSGWPMLGEAAGGEGGGAQTTPERNTSRLHGGEGGASLPAGVEADARLLEPLISRRRGVGSPPTGERAAMRARGYGVDWRRGGGGGGGGGKCSDDRTEEEEVATGPGPSYPAAQAQPQKMQRRPEPMSP